MELWTEEKIIEIYNSDNFISQYENYCSNNLEQKKLLQFLNNIKLNEKYFRLTTNNRIGKNKKFRNKNISNDTLALKEVNSLLNKLTDKNMPDIIQKIKIKLDGKYYLKHMVINNILLKCVSQPSYNKYFIESLLKIYENDNKLIDSINNEITIIETKIKIQEIDKSQSEYMQFCEKNAKLDLLIGYSLLVTELEKMNIIHNNIIPLLNDLIEILIQTKDNDEKYKCVQCLYYILKSYYGDNKLSNEFSEKINSLIKTEKSNKIKFKLMDIIERK